MSESAAQHHAVLGRAVAALAPGERPEVGPIAILPEAQAGTASESEGESERTFARAVTDAGGSLAALSPATRGLVWLSYQRAGELGQVLADNPQIGWVQLPWAGVDAFADVLTDQVRPGLVVTSAKGAYAQPVAEHALALTLALMRVLPKRARATEWDLVPDGRSLYGASIVIVGAGGIARELIRLLVPFNAQITVVRRSSEPVPGAAETVTSDRLRATLPGADVLIVAAALTPGTRHLIGAPELALLPRHARLVNIARGGLVDTSALTRALAAGTLAGAALDVTDPEPLPVGHPLWTEPGCLITPHMADTPEMTAPLLAERIGLNVRAFLTTGRFVGVVDPGFGY